MPTELKAPQSYGRVTKSTGPEIPAIDDDYYEACIKDVQQGATFDGTGEQFVIEWEMTEGPYKSNGEPMTLRQYVNIPAGVHDGNLNEKSNLYALLVALGYEDDDMEIEPANWQGLVARINVENKVIKQGDNAGQTRPRITGVKPSKGTGPKAAAAAQARRTPPARKRGDAEDDF